MLSPPPMSRARTSILAARRDEVSRDQMLRVLMEHREWLVPVSAMARSELAVCCKVSFGPRAQTPPSELWVFTETATAQSAQTHGAVLGSFAMSIDGARLFGTLLGEAEVLRVNPAGYPEDVLTFDRAQYAELERWAGVVARERELGSADGVTAGALLRTLSEVHVPLLPDGRMVAKPGHDGFAQPGVACTSRDSYEAFVGALDPSFGGSLRHVVLDGSGLCAELGRQGEVDAIYLNPFGPGPQRTLARRDVA